MVKKKLIYVSSPYTGAVVEGQVYELLEYYKQQDWFEDILLLQSYSSEEDRRKGEEILNKFSFRRKFFWMNPFYSFLYRKSVRGLSGVIINEVYENTVIHVRGGMYARYVREALPERFKNALILDEFRGLFSDEQNYLSRSNVIDTIKKYLRSYHVRHCNKIMQQDNQIIYTAVSPLLREIEAKEDGFDINKISMHPNVAAPYFRYDPVSRNRLRRELGVPEDKILVVMSSGESTKWQKDTEVAETLTKKGYFVLNLSRKKLDLPNVFSMFVPHKEMPAYLSACDAALLWRDDTPLNHVACPSKYCEFAVMGLYVIHNNTIDIVSRFIREHNAGQLIDNKEDINLSSLSFSENERLKRCEAGYKVFSMDVIASSYYKILCCK